MRIKRRIIAIALSVTALGGSIAPVVMTTGGTAAQTVAMGTHHYD